MGKPDLRKSTLFLLLLIIACLLLPSRSRADEILISASASLSDILQELGVGYQFQSKHTVKFNFASSIALARQIEEGAPVDIFFSADLPQMDYLEKNNLLEPGTRKELLSNQLVIIVASDSKLRITSPRDLLKDEVKKIAIAEPSSVPIGVYSSKYLTDEGLWSQLKPKIVPVQDTRATLAAVQSGNVDTGFVYRTDAAGSRKVKIAHEVPFARGPKITYPVAIVKQSRQKDAARDFLNYVQTPAAKDAFTKYGFIVLQ